MFINREEAANLLAEKLLKYKNSDGVILAVPRGGVPLGYVLSKKLNLPLDLVMTKKIGHPASPEYAIGSVSLHGRILSEHARGISEHYIEEQTQKLRQQMLQKLKIYDGRRKQYELKNKNVILVDDGIATGSTLMAAIEIIRTRHPKKIIIAVPVSPVDTARTISSMVDEFICLLTPDNFQGVGQFYEDFSQVRDEEVIDFLRQNEKLFSNDR